MLRMCTRLFLFLVIAFPFTLPLGIATEIVSIQSNYTSSEGIQAGRLIDNPGWVGSGYLDVDPTVGRVIHPIQIGVPTDSNGPVHFSTGVLDTFPGMTFGVGDRINVQTQLQFTLGTFSFGQEIARIGFSRTPAGKIEHGFAMSWNEGRTQPSEQAGTIRFFPDMNDSGFRDYPFSNDDANSIGVQGRYAGLRNSVSGTDDLTSNPFLINYEVEYLGEVESVGDNVWEPRRLEITDQVSNATFYYDFGFQLPQTIQFDGTNAFLGQELASNGRSSNGLIVTSDSLNILYRGNPMAIAVPEPGSFLCLALVFGAICLRRKAPERGLVCGR
ncbi:hypothetical protein CA13_11090 [Planctomycetes bacterium CA13]|uniref:Ice-binding protein C-terminal domain-containing protein n=1 Tax=Novipirellula herctigrandis TaxID=2527986 RepID=A0A5C5YXF3_9BACT|nr:hypothetical protein CA13_11090 [Planctomycetes bacterium CA13]